MRGFACFPAVNQTLLKYDVVHSFRYHYHFHCHSIAEVEQTWEPNSSCESCIIHPVFVSNRSRSVGATGYIGGDALHEIVQKHPEYEIVCLVRDSDQGALVASQYEKIRLVYGNLDSVELLELEARKADIVLSELNVRAIRSDLSLFPPNTVKLS
jgi:hypothetical protein